MVLILYLYLCWVLVEANVDETESFGIAAYL